MKASPIETNVLVVGVTRSIDEVHRRIEELKQRSIPDEKLDKEFQYDRDEPLHLTSPDVEPDQSEED
jgi:hypothetical protein